MTVEDIKLLYQYNFWANKRILSTAEKVSAEEFSKERPYSWGGLFGTLTHILDAEYSWREFLRDRSEVDILKPEDFADLAALSARWDAEEAIMWAYLDSLSDDDLKGVLRYETSNGTQRNRVLWHCLVHVVNHGTQHRSECAVMLTDLNQSPGEIDMTLFMDTQLSG